MSKTKEDSDSCTNISEIIVYINIENKQWSSVLKEDDWIETIQKIARETLEIHDSRQSFKDRIFNCACVALSVLMTDDAGIQNLNRDYLQKDRPTNVLSFPSFLEKDLKEAALSHKDAEGALLLGDIAFSFETMQRECAEQEKPLLDHFFHLTIHSILHLIGYDHQVDEEAELMEKTEADILKKFNINNPYA